MPEEFNSSSEEQTISLHNILKVFEDGLKEEQTWAVAYKTVKEFKLNTTTDVANNPKKSQLRCVQTYDDLLITASGRAIIKETCKPAEDAQQAIQCLANTLHASLVAES